MKAVSAKERLIVWLAQGFGSGLAPVAPGTFGTVVGIGWFALLPWQGNLALYVLGTVTGVLASVWACGEAERILGRKDPGSVVLDEIAAMPVAFLGWVLMVHSQTGAMPGPAIFFQHNWIITIGLFTAFRVFDIWKPWPVRQSQSLPGGWGVTMDDVLAAVYVNVVSVPVLLMLSARA
jgi:phosphatidylglycerophosphatase A